MKDITGYKGLYSATEDGKIWAYPKLNWSGRFLKSWKIGHGYLVVSLYIDKKQKKFLIHRLIAQTFIPNPESLREVNHKDGNKLNNFVSNLEWVTSKQNKEHAWENGSYKHKGEDHFNSKFLNKDIIKIRQLFDSGTSLSKIASLYNSNYFHIRKIVKRMIWKHI